MTAFIFRCTQGAPKGRDISRFEASSTGLLLLLTGISLDFPTTGISGMLSGVHGFLVLPPYLVIYC